MSLLPTSCGRLGHLPVWLAIVMVASAATCHASPGSLEARAGGDQEVTVGQLVTLVGDYSAPRQWHTLAYRWIQTAGPEITTTLEAGSRLYFIPREPGVIRFALVVAGEGTISAPDYVEVRVLPPAAPASSPAGAGDASLDGRVRLGLDRVAGRDRAGAIAAALEETARRATLYESYQALYRELALRLEALVPAGPVARNAWVEHLFGPLSEHLLGALRAEGLDLATPEGQAARWTPAQQARAAAELRRIARALRDASRG